LLLEIALQKEALGFGDVKFVGAIGAFTGWQGAVIVVFGGSVIGSLWLFLAWIWQKKVGVGGPLKLETPEGHPTRLGFGAQVPFGPMLAIAGAIYFLWLRSLCNDGLSAAID
jgi:leader peptidase (prepilin peptidase) / N-methyltransferase